MRTLVFWGDAPLARARARAARGDVILLWGRRDAEPEDPLLKSADWSEERGVRIETAVTEWARAAALVPLLEGRPLRELFHWEGLPLWPLVERFFLGSSSVAAGCVRLVESFGLVFENELPDEVEGVGLREDEVRLLERCCTAKGVLFQGEAPRSRGRPAGAPRRRESPSLVERLRSFRTAFRSSPRAETGSVVFVWPESEAGGRGETRKDLLSGAPPGLRVTVVGGESGLDPESLLDATARESMKNADQAFGEAFLALKEAPSILAAFRHDDVGFADLAAAPDLGAVLRDVLPRAVRRAEGLRALLRSASARAFCARSDDLLALHAGRLAGVPVAAFSDAEDAARVLQELGGASAREAGMVG